MLLVNLDTGPSHRGTDQQAKPELLVQSTHLGKVRGGAASMWSKRCSVGYLFVWLDQPCMLTQLVACCLLCNS